MIEKAITKCLSPINNNKPKILSILYIANARIPTEKAHGVQIIKMCEAFQRQGIEVELIVPFRMQYPLMKQVHNLWTHYDVDTPFRIKHLWTPDFIRFGRKLPTKIRTWLYYLQSFIFSTAVLLTTMFRQHDVYYSRDLRTIILLCLAKRIHRKRIYFEAHEFHGEPGRTGIGSRLSHRIMRWILRHIDGLIVITHRLKTLYIGIGIREQYVFVAPDGLDKKRLSLSFDKMEERKKLHIPLDKKIICYTGHLFQWKGVYPLVESIRYLPKNYWLYVVGGVEADIDALKRFIQDQQLGNITMTGYVPYHEVSGYLGAADVLVLPNTAKAKISREYTSPLKLFEYMGAQRPIVASDLPSIREVLRHKENAYLVLPDDPKALAEGILAVLNNEFLAKEMTTLAYQEVQKYTWDSRAEKIIAFLQR